jgi:cell division protein FtsL
MRKKRILLLVVGFLLILGLLTFFGEKGILHTMRLQRELAKIQEDNRQIEMENQKLKEEVRRLKVEKRYIEEIARKELGMVKEGEVIYQFDPPKNERERPK